MELGVRRKLYNISLTHGAHLYTEHYNSKIIWHQGVETGRLKTGSPRMKVLGPRGASSCIKEIWKQCLAKKFSIAIWIMWKLSNLMSSVCLQVKRQQQRTACQFPATIYFRHLGSRHVFKDTATFAWIEGGREAPSQSPPFRFKCHVCSSLQWEWTNNTSHSKKNYGQEEIGYHASIKQLRLPPSCWKVSAGSSPYSSPSLTDALPANGIPLPVLCIQNDARNVGTKIKGEFVTLLFVSEWIGWTWHVQCAPRKFNPWSVLVSAILREGMICSFLGHKSFHASSASCKANIKISRCKKTAFSDGSISKNIKINLSQENVYCIRSYTYLWISYTFHSFNDSCWPFWVPWVMWWVAWQTCWIRMQYT